MNLYSISSLLASLICILMAIFVFFKDRKSSVSKAFSIMIMLAGAWTIFPFVASLKLGYPDNNLFLIRLIYIFAVLVPPCSLFFIQLFFQIINKSSEKRILAGFFLVSLLLATTVFSPRFINTVECDSRCFIKPGIFYDLFVGYFLICCIYSFFLFINFYGKTAVDKKNQYKYVISAFVFAYLSAVLHIISSYFNKEPIPHDIFLIGFPTLIAYAIIRHRLLDISTVVHKTVMWLVSSSLILFPITGIFYLAHLWISHLTLIQLSLLVWGLTILLIPYVKYIQPKIDHLFQRRKYDMQNILKELMQELAGLKNLDNLIAKIASTIQKVLYVSKISVIIWDDKNQDYKIVGKVEKLDLGDPCLTCMKEQNDVVERDEIEFNPKYESIRSLALSYFQKFEAKIILPLIHDGKLVGVINLGEKDNLKSFSKMDIDFLSNLKTQASIALSNSLLYDNVHRMSEELKQWSVQLEHKVEDRTRELAERKKELEESYVKLKELDQAKTEFFANVSHELRTPLTLILLPLEMALNKEFGEISPDLQKGLTTVKTNGLRLLNLINGLLDLAKTDAGKMELFKSKCDLTVTVQGILSSLSLIADKKNIRFSFEARTPIPEFYFDREKIERIFINIISNALKFTDFDGTISVTLEMKGDLVESRVKDTGIGIPEKSLEKIFERFTQVDSSSSRKYQGTGLGLALCKEFVELHGGKIRAESVLGEGSDFILTLPLILSVEEKTDPVDRRVKELETKVKRRNEDLTKKLSISALYESTDFEKHEKDSIIQNESGEVKYKILIVEDNAQMREYISSILKREFTVITAQNGVEGLEKVKTYLPDLVVSDLMMPLKDGFQLCKELKTAPESRHIPILLLTAKSDISNKIEGLELGANEYLSKPFNTAELLARVKSLLQLKELEKENAMSKKMAAMAVMVAGVIHEINNPISFTKTSWTTISESFEKLKEIIQVSELKNKEEEISELIRSTDTALDIVHKGIERIQQVINRLRVFDGRQSPQFESIQLDQLLDQLVARMEEGFTDSQKELIEFQKELQLHKPIEGIPVLLTQTFEVVIDNALKATRGIGRVKIKTWQGGEGNVCISIKDNGCGIKKEKLDHLFEPFFTLRDVGNGMGLGLFLAHQVIQAHHGSVMVNSVENEGTEMIIQLPVIQPQNYFQSRQRPYQSMI